MIKYRSDRVLFTYCTDSSRSQVEFLSTAQLRRATGRILELANFLLHVKMLTILGMLVFMRVLKILNLVCSTVEEAYSYCI